MKKNLVILAICITALSSCINKNQSDADAICKDNREEPDFSNGVMDEKILWYLGRLADVQMSPDGKTILYSVTYYDYRSNTGNTDLYTMPIDGGEPTRITSTKDDEIQPIWRPDGKKIAYLYPDDNGTLQIWECNPNGKHAEQITDFENDVNCFSYSPDMKHLCYAMNVRIDPTIEQRYPDLPKANAMIYDDLMYRHWNYWADGTYSHLFVTEYPKCNEGIDLLKGEKFHCPTPPYGGIEEIAWSPDSKSIAYTCKKLSGKQFAESTNTDIYLYNLAKKTHTNLSEGNMGYDQAPVFSPDGSKLVWWSMETDGFESDKHRMMIYDFKTNTREDYTADFDQNATDFCWSNDGKKIYFKSDKEATIQIYSMELATRKFEQITDGDYDYNSLILCGDQLITTRTTHAYPSEIYAVNLKNKAVKQISFINKDVLDKITLAKTEKRWVKTTDGKDMLVWVILPPNFDSTKTYPALLYCEGGPQSPVSQFFSYRWNFQMMAAHGYIVVAPNRRGLPGFGQEWNDEISGDFGGQCMKDYLSAIDAVSKESYVDENRLGCVGASFGGFSVYWLAGHHDKRFKAFIAHCGMFNLESWYNTTEELFFANHDIEGPYWKTPTPKSYDFSPHKFVGNWDTPILVIHGGNDFRIPYTEGMQAFDVAQIKGIPSRFLYFPDECHFVTKPQNSMLWQREFFRWLDQWLKTDEKDSKN
ncbi:MAG: S9 family peptidase [Bacteroidales bacterium]|nr:S9 family peptidase [Bacteroidales bacterium]